LNNLSDKELLEVMMDFPKHELNTKQRTEILKIISEAGSQKPKKQWKIQRLGAICALFVFAALAPLLYYLNTGNRMNSSASDHAGSAEAEQADYFALTENGESFYIDSNYGIPDKVSLLAPKDWIAKDERSVAKIMIFFWGNYEKKFANKNLTVNAIHEKTGVREQLASTTLSGPIYGADAHSMTSFKPFSDSGKWDLQFAIDGKEFAAFSIYVKKPYVQTDKWTLMMSQEDLYAGFYEDVPIEVTGEDLPEEIELEVFSLETGEITKFTFGNKSDYTASDGKKISMYQGDFQIKKSGQYRFTAVNSSQAVEIGRPISN